MMNVTESDKVILSTLHSTIFILGLPGNILVITAFCSSKEFRSRPSTSCLIMLTIADLLTCMCAVPYYTTGLLVRKFDMIHISRYTNLCKVTLFIITTAGIVRIFAFTIMSIDRFVAIAYPYHYNNRSSRLKVLILAIIIWIHASLSSLPAVLVDGWVIYNAKNEALCRFTSPPNSIFYTAPMVIINFTAPTIAVLVMNCRVFVIARKQLRRVTGETEKYCPICKENKSDADVSQVKESKTKQQNQRPEEERPKVHSGDDDISKHDDTNKIISYKETSKVTHTKPSNKQKPKKFKTKNGTMTPICEAKENGDLESREVSEIVVEKVHLPENKNRRKSVNWLRRQSFLLKRNGSNSRCRHMNVNRNSRELVIAISTLFLAFAFIVTWAPYVITRLIITIWKEANSPRLQTYTSATTVLNSGLNPVIILVTRREVRRILLRKFRL